MDVQGRHFGDRSCGVQEFIFVRLGENKPPIPRKQNVFSQLEYEQYKQ
jgi:hypothetical protein